MVRQKKSQKINSQNPQQLFLGVLPKLRAQVCVFMRGISLLLLLIFALNSVGSVLAKDVETATLVALKLNCGSGEEISSGEGEALKTDARAGSTRQRHEKLALDFIHLLGLELEKTCPSEPAFIDHFGTPVCTYISHPWDEFADLLVSYLSMAESVEIGRVHSSTIESFAEFYYEGWLHLIDFATKPDRQGRYLVEWFIPDFRD